MNLKALLIEDCREVREFLELVIPGFFERFQLKGSISTLSAKDAVEAEAVWDRNCNNIDLVIADVMLPGGKNGSQLVKEFLKQKPTLAALLMSGYPQEFETDGVPLLHKPFQPSKLDAAIWAVLERRKGERIS